jgi:hypothetical protein
MQAFSLVPKKVEKSADMIGVLVSVFDQAAMWALTTSTMSFCPTAMFASLGKYPPPDWSIERPVAACAGCDKATCTRQAAAALASRVLMVRLLLESTEGPFTRISRAVTTIAVDRPGG